MVTKLNDSKMDSSNDIFLVKQLDILTTDAMFKGQRFVIPAMFNQEIAGYKQVLIQETEF